jgi:hypothetical protein
MLILEQRTEAFTPMAASRVLFSFLDLDYCGIMDLLV